MCFEPDAEYLRVSVSGSERRFLQSDTAEHTAEVGVVTWSDRLPRFLNGKANKRAWLAESDFMTRFSPLTLVDG